MSIDKFVISLYILIDISIQMYWLITSSLYKLSTTFLFQQFFFGVKFLSLSLSIQVEEDRLIIIVITTHS
jgi:hypothetical protein